MDDRMELLTGEPNYQSAYVGWYCTDDTYDGPGSPMGWGTTKEAALEDLLEALDDQAGCGTCSGQGCGDCLNENDPRLEEVPGEC